MSIKIDNEFLDYIEGQVLELKKAIDGKDFNEELREHPIFVNTYNYDDILGQFDFTYGDLNGTISSDENGKAYVTPYFEFHDHDFWFNFEYIEE